METFFQDDPRINVYDIEVLPNGKWEVKTYRRKGERIWDFNKRHQNNIKKARILKRRKPTKEVEVSFADKMFFEILAKQKPGY